MWTSIDFNIECFAFLDSSHFKTTEWCKARITALALPYQTSIFSSCFPSLVNATPRYLNFSSGFNDTPPTRKEHCRRSSTYEVDPFLKHGVTRISVQVGSI